MVGFTVRMCWIGVRIDIEAQIGTRSYVKSAQDHTCSVSKSFMPTVANGRNACSPMSRLKMYTW